MARQNSKHRSAREERNSITLCHTPIRRLRWLGHVSRMDDSRIPKQVLYGELCNGKRSTGRPKLRYKDQCKATMTDLSIDSENWDELAKDRSRWRSAVHKGAKSFEAVRIQHAVEARQRRKEAALVERPSSLWHCRYCQRPCNARIGLYSHERYCSKKPNWIKPPINLCSKTVESDDKSHTYIYILERKYVNINKTYQ